MLAKFVGLRKVRALAAVITSLMLVMATAATAVAAGGGTWSVSDAQVVEGNTPGNGNTTSLVFTIHYARAAGDTGNVRVHYAASGGTATRGANCTGTVDYRTASGNSGYVVSDAGQASYDVTVTVNVCGDTAYEPDETFTLTLTKAGSGGSNTTISATNGSATGKILNDDSQTTVSSSSLTSTFGQGVTFTANVDPATATGGTVTFYDGATSIGTCTLAAGTCALAPITTLTVATHQITATWAGNTGGNPFGGSTSVAIAQVVTKASSSTIVSGVPNPSTFGVGVIFTANVTPATATGGTVTFYNGGVSMAAAGGTCTLNAGTCSSAAITNLTLGNHQITATWAGNGSYNTSTSPAITQTVGGIPTTATVSSSANPSVQGHAVTFTATVTSGSGTPAGTITFYDGASSIGTCTLNTGSCTLATSSLTIGTHSITVGYGGGGNYAGTTSGALAQVVTAYGPAAKIVWGQAPTDVFTGATITPAVTVIVEDTYGNTVLNSTASIGIAIQTGTGTLSGGSAVNAVNGVATFSGLSIDTRGAFTLRASSAGLGNVDGNLNVVLPLSVSVYKELCASYGLVPGNSTPTNVDQTGGHGGDLGPGSGTVVVLPAECQPADGWQFAFGPSGGTPVQTSPLTVDGTASFDFNIAAVELARSTSHLWISEVTNPSLAGFAAIRCTGDMANGDNVEQFIGITDSVSHVDCVAFNVKQTIDFAAVGNQTIGVAPIPLSATATSVLPVTFSTQVGDPCSVSAGVLTLSGIGTCHVIASQAGQATIETGTAAFPFWSPAFDVMQTITIAPIAQTITFNQPADVAYGVAPFDLTATAPGGPVTFSLTGGTCSVTPSGTVTALGAGSCIVTADQAGGGNYAAAPSVTRSFAINPAVLTVTADDKSMAYGDPVPGLTAQISGYVNGDPVTVVSGVAILGTAADSTSHAGTYPITVNVLLMSAANYTFTGVDGTLTVGPTSQSITFDFLADKTYGDGTFDLTATAPGGSITYTASGDCNVTSDGTVTITGAGSCTITAHQSGGGDYTSAPPVSQSFNIAKAVLTVAGDPKTKSYGEANPDLTATITGLKYTDTLSVVSGTPTLDTTAGQFSDAGGYPITVDVSAMSADNYTFSGVSGILTVEPIGQAITFGSLADKTYGDPKFDVSASSTSGLAVTFTASGDCTVTSGGTVTIVGAGSCTITADQTGNGDYDPAPSVAQSFGIAQAHLTANADDKTMVYGGSVPPLTYTITGFVNDDTAASVDFTGSLVLYTTADSSSPVNTYVISDSIFTLSTDNYSINFALGYLTITKADQTITFVNPGSKQVNAAPFALGATTTSPLTVTYTFSGPCTVDASGTLTITGAGDCSVTASQSGDTNYNAATPVTQVFSIGKLDQKITFINPGTQVFGVAPFDLGATADSGLAVTYTVNKVLGVSSSCTVSGSIVTLTGAGFCSVTASQPGDATYNPAANVTRYFLINKTTQSITFAPLPDVTFGVAPITLTATASSGLPVNYLAIGKCTVSGGVLTITGVGNCVVTASQPGNASFWPAVPVVRTFAISKADQVITFANPGTRTYGDASFNLGATAPGGPVTYQVTDGTCTVDAAGKLTIHNTGDCTVLASQAGNANYNAATDVSQTFTVKPAQPQITVSCDISAVYTGSPLTGNCTALLKGPGMVDTDITGLITFTPNVGVGTVTASAHRDADANYLAADGQATFEIVATGSTIAIDCPPSVPYTGSIIEPCTATATGDGMDPVTLKGDEIVYSGNINAGTATISASWGGSLTNGGNSGSRTFEITRVDLVIAANDQTMAVGDASFDLGHINFTPTGLLGNDQVNIADLASSGANPAAAEGTYAIAASNATGVGLDNYNIHYVTGTLTVTDKFVLTVTADDKTRDYKKANPTFTYHITGYQDGDGASVVTTDPECSTAATIASLPGSYHITCDGADAASGKYVFTYVTGNLEITGNVVGGATAPPTATAAGGNPADSDALPLFALLICMAFGGLGLLAAQAQRKSTRA